MEGYISDSTYLGSIILKYPQNKKKDRKVQAKSTEYTSIGLSLASFCWEIPRIAPLFCG